MSDTWSPGSRLAHDRVGVAEGAGPFNSGTAAASAAALTTTTTTTRDKPPMYIWRARTSAAGWEINNRGGRQSLDVGHGGGNERCRQRRHRWTALLCVSRTRLYHIIIHRLQGSLPPYMRVLHVSPARRHTRRPSPRPPPTIRRMSLSIK